MLLIMLGLLSRSLIALMAACIPAGQIQCTSDLGVGFNLALDYG
jgi:hypothetical protein